MASSLKGRIKIGKIENATNSGLRTQYEVNAVPTIKFFPPGSKLDPPEEFDIVGKNSSEDLI